MKQEKKSQEEEKVLEFIIAEEKYYKKIHKLIGLNLHQRYQESSRISQSNKLYHQKYGRYKFFKIRSPKDKRLRQIDKLKHGFLLLLAQVYLFESAPSRKQKRFVFLFRRRKDRQRLKQREREKAVSYETDIESNYSNHSVEEKIYDNNEKTCKKSQEQIQSS
jgi:hypothetical protein